MKLLMKSMMTDSKQRKVYRGFLAAQDNTIVSGFTTLVHNPNDENISEEERVQSQAYLNGLVDMYGKMYNALTGPKLEIEFETA